MASATQRAANLEAIRQTAQNFSPGADIRGLHAIATRESGMNHYVSSRGEADRKGAIRALKRNRGMFEAAGNPWLDDLSLWHKSLGLYQHMVPNHLQRWDPVAHPNALRHPVVSTVVAGRLWNRAIQLGAKNLCDLRSLWARGNLGHDPDYARRCASTRKRLESLGYSASLADRPLREFRLEGFGTRPTADQYQRLWALSEALGLPSQPEQAPEHWNLKSPGDGPDGGGPPPGPPDQPPPSGPLEPGHDMAPLIAGTIGLGVTAVIMATTSKRRRRS